MTRFLFQKTADFATLGFMKIAATVIAFAVLLFAGSARAIVVGQIDDFEDDTLQGWANGGESGVPPVLNIDTGGPAGAGDNFLQISSDGSGVGRFLTVFNRSQWLGDYVVAGVTAIEMDLKNLGNVELTIRLGFKDGIGGSASGYLSQGFTLAVGGDWQHVVFLIDPANLVAVGSPSPFASFFSEGLQEVRIINEAGTSNLNGDAVVGQLGIDNIHAVPEPGTTWLSIAALIGCVAMMRGAKASATPARQPRSSRRLRSLANARRR